MAVLESPEIITKIQSHALGGLNAEARTKKTNLHLDRRIYNEGEPIGPAFQELTAPKPCVVVFADDDPMANFAHNCRYMLYDPQTGELHTVLPARFPPFATPKPPATLAAFHIPVRSEPDPEPMPAPTPVRPAAQQSAVAQDDGAQRRFAILFSGMSNIRHVNDLEFCYRMLVDRYKFQPQNIQALNFDGSLEVRDWRPLGNWPGDNTPYRIQITGKGNREGFQAALAAVGARIGPNDVLFIHTNNHGEFINGEANICTYPDMSLYSAGAFCADLATLPKYQALIVMMEQCCSGGFINPVLQASTASNTSIAAAAIETNSSYMTHGALWDAFARDWIAAQMGHLPGGDSLTFNPDYDNDHIINADKAFRYADGVHSPPDSPICGYTGLGSYITLRNASD